MADPTKPGNPYPPPGTALSLIALPYVFTQDDLLATEKFISEAKRRGVRLTLQDLQNLHNYRLLLPLYRVSDIPVVGRRIAVKADGGMNARGWTLEAAAEGRLHDSADEGYSAAWPYERPAGEDAMRWWNGFVYSSWQLLFADSAMRQLADVRQSRHFPPLWYKSRAQEARRLTVVLAALSTSYLPGVLGRLTMPGGTDESGLREYRARAQVHELLEVAGFSPMNLQRCAEAFLGQAHSDPLVKWLPLLRYANYKGWSKLAGKPLDSMWRRVAAEILLRAHEDLAAEGVVEPLPDLTGAGHWTMLHDRLTPQYKEAQTLERALAELGLSPYPKVILLVEGETELYHVPRLLAEFGITQPQDVRVQRTKSSKINAHLIARYGVTPRVGRKIGDRWLLDASPTALVIAMDPENHFATQDKRDKVRKDLQDAIREEVQYQDADISQDELDGLVRVHVWGDHTYELANFTDDELIPAITAMATRQQSARVESATWEADLRAELQAARAAHHDIKVVMGRMRLNEDKVEMAKLLLPVLLAKCEAEYIADDVQTPVLKVALEVRQLVGQWSGVFALRGPA